MLELNLLTCIRGERTLFKELSVGLAESSLLIVKGANGAGKTSLLNLVCGLLAPTSGSITFNGCDVRGNTDFYTRTAYIGAKNGLKESETVRENLMFYAKLNGNPILVEGALKFFDLSTRAEEQVGTLSSGLKRRVALARLLLGNYAVWLLDEPTNFLDSEGIALLTSLIESRVNQGGIVLIASHTMGSQFPAHMLQLEDFA